jgi:hypothetical protein
MMLATKVSTKSGTTHLTSPTGTIILVDDNGTVTRASASRTKLHLEESDRQSLLDQVEVGLPQP